MTEEQIETLRTSSGSYGRTRCADRFRVYAVPLVGRANASLRSWRYESERPLGEYREALRALARTWRKWSASSGRCCGGNRGMRRAQADGHGEHGFSAWSRARATTVDWWMGDGQTTCSGLSIPLACAQGPALPDCRST